MHADDIPLYVLAAIGLGGIGFLLWALIHLFFEARFQRGQRAQAVEHYRLRR